jgi:outer membrane protein W
MTPSYSSNAGARRLAAAVTLVVAAGATAAPAGAQAQVGQWSVAARGGMINFERASSIEPSPYVGLDADYGLNNLFTLGTTVTVSRPKTHKEDFLTSLTYGQGTTGDTTFFYNVGQTMSMVEAEFSGTLRYPVGRFTPFAIGGVGYYGLFLDPQINNGVKRQDGMSFSVGAGFLVKLSERAGLQFDARNLTLTNFSQSALDPAGGRNPNVLFPEDFPVRPEAKKSINNLVWSIGFRYIPGGEISDDPRDPNMPREDRR